MGKSDLIYCVNGTEKDADKFSKTKPKVGLLMIPKTCAYMWIIAMGLQLLF